MGRLRHKNSNYFNQGIKLFENHFHRSKIPFRIWNNNSDNVPPLIHRKEQRHQDLILRLYSDEGPLTLNQFIVT